MTELKVFNYLDTEVRTIMINDEPWWVLIDICKILEIGNSRNVTVRLEEDEKGVHSIDTHGGKQELTIINESGLYNAILLSRKPEAKQFKRWVTHEVLPSIRKHGMYAVNDLLDNPDLAIQAFTALKEEREKNKQLVSTVAVQTQQIAELKPKASYYDVVLNCKDLISTSSIAKDYGKSAIWLNRYLHEKNVQFKQGDIWLLYQKYASMGYTSTKTQSYNGSDGEVHTKIHTYWTQKGRLFIYALLKNDGYLPTIEQDEAA